jgi:general stress protein 26
MGVEADPNVCLTTVYPKENVYLFNHRQGVRGPQPKASQDAVEQGQQIWWPGGPQDPNLLAMKVEPERAEMWEGQCKLGGGSLRVRESAAYRHEARKVSVEID